ncbi:hypothetical protein J45TS6_09080 [Paenibacillus sp. J45TS6]|nr:hypothetical protein J45TS6_09080 [Paenibacillus sp. J45TS6]
MRIMEKYSFSVKKQRAIRDRRDTTGLKRVAKQKIKNIPHHVLRRVPIAV